VRLYFVLANVLSTHHGIVLFDGILLGHWLFIASNNHRNKQVQHTITYYKIVLKFRRI
jgi:hypothetical protein